MVIGVTDEEPSLVDDFVQKYKPTFPIVIIKNKDFDQALGVSGFPSAAMIDPSGNLAATGHPMELEPKVGDYTSKAKPGSVIPAKFNSVMAAVRARNLAKAYADLKKVSGADKKWTDRMTTFLEGEAASAFAAAKAASEEGLLYEATKKVQSVAKASPPFPVTKEAAALLKSFETGPKYKLEMSGGEKFEKIRELENKGDYTKAVEGYSEIIKSCPGTKIGEAARARGADLIDKGMPGFNGNCQECGRGRKACDKHKENVKL